MNNVKSNLGLGGKSSIRVAYISSYLPRKCGIATFTDDLIRAIDKICPDQPANIIAVTDPGQSYDYPDNVVVEINQYNRMDYVKAARYVNESSIDVVSLQHEFGLYTGPDSSYTCCLSAGAKDNANNNKIENGYYMLAMLDMINKPIVTTLHTILSSPDEQQMYVVKRIIEKSAAIIAMTEVSRQTLLNFYNCPADKVYVISHGVPDFDFNHVKKHQEKLGIENASPMIMSAGLLGPGKELEYIINAMPDILKTAPSAKLYIVGQTHPVIVRNEGEVYREKLVSLIKSNNISDSVVFINHYLSDEELQEYYQAADFFVTAYSNMQQSASGTLAWAVGAGKVCISTPYQYAQELLSGGAGVLIESKNSQAIATSVIDLYNNPQKAEDVRNKAYKKGHQFIWASVGVDYMKLFKKSLIGESGKRQCKRVKNKPKTIQKSYY
jgi:glycosyltransferase involved in cell wall biosynthesis